jgi:ATP-binding protein involved in chromosome partitioning
MGSILDHDKAAVWRGPMLSGAIKQLINSTEWGDLDYLLIDMPPGTGDAYLTVFNEIKVDHFILVTSPSILAMSDAKKTISLLERMDINILGYISNNIFNSEEILSNKFLIEKNIKNLGNFNFDKNIYNFDINYESQDAIDITAVIESNV